MYGLSTSWRSGTITDGKQLLNAIKETEINGLEIDYRIRQSTLDTIRKRLKSSEFNVLSVHAQCPMPDHVSVSMANAELYDLSSDDRDEHNMAIKQSIKSIEVAADLEAEIVVFHLGKVDMEAERELFFATYELKAITGEEYRQLVQRKLQERAERSFRPFDRVLKGLDKIHKAADRMNILIGVENRYFYNQIPFMEEFDTIFNEFSGGQIRYWHDVGHAEVFHRLGFLDHEKDLLKKYKDVLAGMHIHDIKGLKDHLAPGLGDFNFAILKKYLRNNMVKILEVHDEAEPADIQRGVELLQQKNIL